MATVCLYIFRVLSILFGTAIHNRFLSFLALPVFLKRFILLCVCLCFPACYHVCTQMLVCKYPRERSALYYSPKFDLIFCNYHFSRSFIPPHPPRSHFSFAFHLSSEQGDVTVTPYSQFVPYESDKWKEVAHRSRSPRQRFLDIGPFQVTADHAALVPPH